MTLIVSLIGAFIGALLAYPFITQASIAVALFLFAGYEIFAYFVVLVGAIDIVYYALKYLMILLS